MGLHENNCKRSGVEASVVKLKQVEHSRAELKGCLHEILVCCFRFDGMSLNCISFLFLTPEQSAIKANLISGRMKCSEALV